MRLSMEFGCISLSHHTLERAFVHQDIIKIFLDEQAASLVHFNVQVGQNVPGFRIHGRFCCVNRGACAKTIMQEEIEHENIIAKRDG